MNTANVGFDDRRHAADNRIQTIFSRVMRASVIAQHLAFCILACGLIGVGGTALFSGELATGAFVGGFFGLFLWTAKPVPEKANAFR